MKYLILTLLGLTVVWPTAGSAKTSVSVGGSIGFVGDGFSIGISSGYGHGYYGGYRLGYDYCGPRRYYSRGGWYPWGISLGYTYAPAPVYYPAPVVYESPAPPVVYSSPPPSAVVYNPPPAATRPSWQPPAKTTPAAAKPRVMSTAEVKALVKAKLSDEVIISQIRSSRTVFHLKTDEIIELRDSGVSEDVIKFMINTANP
ncbi:MAG: hypothetical protein PCFJNLEI_02468 [Verrucomicrobiae bacterium]|nr:hypothetical protein [Verrucomicrobiae bacterium]